jgi:hypothetical protein
MVSITAASPDAHDRISARSRVRRRWPLALFLVSLVVGITARVAAGWHLPLWLDETFTGTIAGQPGVTGLLRWCLIELTGPAFYGPMWLWAKVAGTGNIALRAPMLLLSIVAPLLLAWRGHPDRDLRLLWATLALAWLPILPMATEARPYPQLFFLGCLQAMLFMRTLERRDRRSAFAWAAVTAFAALTHYYSLIIGGFQGLALLIAYRRALLRLWPAAVAFVPVALWMMVHLPFVLGFAAGRAGHYDPMPVEMVLFIPMLIFGVGLQGFAILALVGATHATWSGSALKPSPEAQLVWTGVAAFALLFLVGLAEPIMQPRYLTPAVPALLFGLACWAMHVSRRRPLVAAAPLLLMIAAMAQSLLFGAQDPRFRERRNFSFEEASRWLDERPFNRLTFAWSTPTGAQAQADPLANVAGFFFRRSGHPRQVTIVRTGRDPNSDLLASAARTGSTAILWISDDPLPDGVVAQIERRDAAWECRDFGGAAILVYACRARAAT